MAKKLILNADDFGLTSGINYGILHAYLNQSISSTNLMVNAPETLEAVKIIKQYHINCVGIHINLTLGYPVSESKEIPSLLDQNGCFHNLSWWMDNHQVNEDELMKEFDNQIALFEELVGYQPTHITYHHRYDFYENYPALAQHLFEKYQLPMRLERDYDKYTYQYAKNQTYFLNPNQPLEDYLQDDLIEMPCHVGFVDKKIMEISGLNMQRIEDSYLVNSKEFKNKYKKLGYELVNWNEVKKKL